MHGHIHGNIDAHGGEERRGAIVLIVRIPTAAVHHHLWIEIDQFEHSGGSKGERL